MNQIYFTSFFSRTGAMIGLSFSLFFLLLGAYFSMTWTHYISSSTDNQRATIVLDVSKSMLVPDGDETWITRLEKAKKEIGEIISNSTHKFWLTIFSGDAVRILPHVSDKNIFLTYLQSLTRENVSEWGTDIVSALEEAIYDFTENSSGTIILFSDGGEENISQLWEIQSILEKRNIDIYVIWVGTQEGGNIINGYDIFWAPIYEMYQWKRVISRLEEENLELIAKKLGGEYFHISQLQDKDVFWQDKFFDSIDKRSDSLLFAYIALLFWIYVLICFFIQRFWIWRK